MLVLSRMCLERATGRLIEREMKNHTGPHRPREGFGRPFSSGRIKAIDPVTKAGRKAWRTAFGGLPFEPGPHISVRRITPSPGAERLSPQGPYRLLNVDPLRRFDPPRLEWIQNRAWQAEAGKEAFVAETRHR
jgi:hypothetical protein